MSALLLAAICPPVVHHFLHLFSHKLMSVYHLVTGTLIIFHHYRIASFLVKKLCAP